MRKPAPRRSAVAGVAMTAVTFVLGLTVAVFVVGSASAASPTTSKTTSSTPMSTTSTTPLTPADRYFVINGTANAASDHEIVASSAFPNFTTGAVDNYYSMAHAHVDNAPFAEGTASPLDTGPVGQTAAAGNFQQPQYADARWPGDSGKATYGNKGGPYAAAAADDFLATAESSLATNGLSGPSASTGLTVPKGFDGRLRAALAGWKAKWQGRLFPKRPKAPTVTTPKPTVTTPLGTLTAPSVTVGGVKTPPPVTMPATTPPPPPVAPLPVAPPPALPTPTVPSPTASGSRSLASLSKPGPTSSGSASGSAQGDGESLLSSSSLVTLDPKTGALVTSGESSLGRVSLAGGQIVIDGIHVTASMTNDGAPSYKVAVSVASATIGGVPVTIDQDGVHLAGQGQGLPYQQASDALNGALKQAGIQLFLVGPEVVNTSSGSCDQTGGAGGGTDTTTTSTDPSGSSSCGTCDQSGTGTGTGTTTTTTTSTTSTTSTDQSATGSCGDMSGSASCGQAGTGGTGTTTGTTTTTASLTPSTTTTTSSGDQSGTTTTPSYCDFSGTSATTGSCGPPATAGPTTTSSSDQSTTTTPTTTSSGDQMGFGAGGGNAGEETVTATGLHLVFTQPASPPGVPAQSVEHILGEVFMDSLAVPAGPVGSLDFSSSSSFGSSSFSPSSSSSCAGAHGGRSSGLTGSGGGAAGGSSLAGSGSSGSLSPSASGFGSGSQPGSSSAGNSLPAAFALALRKPLWLLLGYLLWQTLVIGTGASLWNWRRGGAS